jgi:hypothetical protein
MSQCFEGGLAAGQSESIDEEEGVFFSQGGQPVCGGEMSCTSQGHRRSRRRRLTVWQFGGLAVSGQAICTDRQRRRRQQFTQLRPRDRDDGRRSTVRAGSRLEAACTEGWSVACLPLALLSRPSSPGPLPCPPTASDTFPRPRCNPPRRRPAKAIPEKVSALPETLAPRISEYQNIQQRGVASALCLCPPLSASHGGSGSRPRSLPLHAIDSCETGQSPPLPS